MSIEYRIMKLIKIGESSRKDKKMMAVFDVDGNGKHKTVHFGAAGYSDFTQNHDEKRKERYLARHAKNEDWKDPTTAGALSRFVLWNKPTIAGSVRDFKNRFSV